LGNRRKFTDRFEQRTKGHNAVDYWLTLDAAKEMAMMERNEEGKKTCRYIIEVGKKFRTQQSAALDVNDTDYNHSPLASFQTPRR